MTLRSSTSRRTRSSDARAGYHRRDPDRPGTADHWSPSLDCASRDELQAIQDAKLVALTPFPPRVRPACRGSCDVEVLAPGTLLRTEFKARRIRDTRRPA